MSTPLPSDPKLLARGMADGTIPFPYKHHHMCSSEMGTGSPEHLFRNLCDREYVVTGDRPFKTGGARPAIARTPWGFDRKQISFVVDECAYDEVDKLTDYFTEEARMAANVRGSPAPLDAFRDPATASKIARLAVSMSKKFGRSFGPGVSDLREACYKLVPECTLFKISLAKEIIRFFGAEVVFDPFSGWGDRGLGAAGAGVKKYVGLDPNPALTEGYARITDFVRRESPEVRMTYRPLPIEGYGPAEFAEDFQDGPPTLAFSSPPFYDYEIYSNDPRQSSRHKTLEDWLDQWFLPAVDRVWGMLAPKGNLALYLTDARGEVTTPLCKHMEKRERRFRGVLACRRGSKRPLPLWVWQKGDAPPPPTMDDYVETLLEDIYATMEA